MRIAAWLAVYSCILLVAILLSGCANIATSVALLNVMAIDEGITNNARVSGNVPVAKRSVVHGKAHLKKDRVGSGPTIKKPELFQERFGHWKKTKLDLWGPA